MLLTILNAASLAVLPAPPVKVAFNGYARSFLGEPWERFDVFVTNRADQPQTLKVCPEDAEQLVVTDEECTIPAFAVRLGKGKRMFECTETLLDSGRRVQLSVFFRPDLPQDYFLEDDIEVDRSVSIITSLGEIVLTYDQGFGDITQNPQNISAELRP